ncbi:MAG: DUF565 domain-containing protein [Prochlorococcus sp. SP3034]|nr:DUF565 domain-containing protein [Prochlorococcus sp. SP3034]|tara:strand:+ start:2042 stop:2383 length:342 start_codon:yes stop_codon:yes gene_type:complete
MVLKPQKTKFQRKVIENIEGLSLWATNPWRKYSLASLLFLFGYFFGSSLGMISAVYNLLDPIGALIAVAIIEFLIFLRRSFVFNKTKKLLLLIIDFLRIGLIYGFFTEGLKLL